MRLSFQRKDNLLGKENHTPVKDSPPLRNRKNERAFYTLKKGVFFYLKVYKEI